jgi:hypothetical protein
LAHATNTTPMMAVSSNSVRTRNCGSFMAKILADSRVAGRHRPVRLRTFEYASGGLGVSVVPLLGSG